jgi:hypothetical protein
MWSSVPFGQCGGVRSAKFTKSAPQVLSAFHKVGYAICRVACNFRALRMFGGRVFKRARLVCLAGLSGASRNRLGNSLANETSVGLPRTLPPG